MMPKKSGSNNLGTNGKSINRPIPARVSGQFAKYDLQRTAQSLLFRGFDDEGVQVAMKDQHRTCWCHRGTTSPNEQVSIYRQENGGSARMHGVTTCKSVWGCPVCSTKICTVRQAELFEAVAAWTKQGGAMWLMTLTFPHDRAQSLADLLPMFTKAKAFFKNSKTYKRILSKGQRKGSVTSLEVTLGQNGWHPHQHDLVFAQNGTYGHVQENENGSMVSSEIDELKMCWYVALLKAGLCEPDQMTHVLQYGLDVRGGQYASEYIAKFGDESKWGLSKEVTMHAAKTGSDQKGAHPFQLLSWVMENNDELAGHQFREYVEAFEGKRMLSWSRGLKKELTGQDETSDEQAADKEMPKESIVGRITSEDLSVLQSRKLLANFLSFVAANCDEPGQEQAAIDVYMQGARSMSKFTRGVVKTKMHSRGFMFTDREAMA